MGTSKYHNWALTRVCMTGKDKEQHYNEKFGEEMLKRNRPHLAAAGKQVGINFSFGGLCVMNVAVFLSRLSVSCIGVGL